MSGSKGKPTLGYPSQTAAVEALWAEGLKPKQIAERTGIPLQSVYTLLSQAKARARGLASQVEPDSKPGIWTTEKLGKARRLFGKTMIMIAEALQVPPKELLEFGLRGVIPPMGEGQRVAALLEEMAQEPAPGGDAPPSPEGRESRLQLPAPAEDERAADEAELAALEEEDDADAEFTDAEPEEEPVAEERGASRGGQDGPARAFPGAPEPLTPVVGADALPLAPKAVAGLADPLAVPMAASIKARFKLRNEMGEYLHEHERGMTRLSRFIWRGTAEDVRSLMRKKPHLRQLEQEPC